MKKLYWLIVVSFFVFLSVLNVPEISAEKIRVETRSRDATMSIKSEKRIPLMKISLKPETELSLKSFHIKHNGNKNSNLTVWTETNEGTQSFLSVFDNKNTTKLVFTDPVIIPADTNENFYVYGSTNKQFDIPSKLTLEEVVSEKVSSSSRIITRFRS